jgi:hypothetical protein
MLVPVRGQVVEALLLSLGTAEPETQVAVVQSLLELASVVVRESVAAGSTPPFGGVWGDRCVWEQLDRINNGA